MGFNKTNGHSCKTENNNSSTVSIWRVNEKNFTGNFPFFCPTWSYESPICTLTKIIF